MKNIFSIKNIHTGISEEKNNRRIQKNPTHIIYDKRLDSLNAVRSCHEINFQFDLVNLKAIS